MFSVKESLDHIESGFSFKKHSHLEDYHKHQEINKQDF